MRCARFFNDPVRDAFYGEEIVPVLFRYGFLK